MPKPSRAFFPCSLTMISMMLGVTAILVLQDNNFVLAALLICIGCVLDTMDGQVAARIGAVSEIGKQLDSLADMVTFGVAPGILVYHLLLRVGVLQFFALAVSLVFIVAGAYRLARFNTLPSNRSAYFTGMPIPMGGILLLAGSFWQHWVVNLWWTAVVVAVSYLMVSAFKFPKLTHLGKMSPIFWSLVLVVNLLCWSMAGWESIPFGLCLMYALSGPLLWLRTQVFHWEAV